MPTLVPAALAPWLALPAAALLLAALSLVGHRLVPHRLRPGQAVVAIPLSLSVGATAVGLATWIVGSLVGTRAALAVAPLLVAISLPALGAWCCSVRRWLCRLVLLARAAPLESALLTLVASLVLPQLALPELSSDGLRYHLALPKLYLLEGSIQLYPWDVHAAMPQAAEMLYLILLPVAAEAAKALHTGCFVVVLAALIGLVHRVARTRRGAVVAAVAFAASPAALASASAAFVDHFVILHVATACLVLGHSRRPLLVGLALAGAAAVKWTAAPAIAGIAVLTLLLHRRRPLATALALAVPVVIATAPVALRNLVVTGDPFFPTGTALVRGAVPGVPSARFAYVTQVHRDLPGPLGLPWGEAVGAVQTDEVVGWHLLAGLLLLPLALGRRAAWPVVAVTLPYLLVGLHFHPSSRLAMPLLYGLAAVTGAAWGRVRCAWIRLAAAVLLAPALVTAGGIQLGFGQPLALLAGRRSRAEILAATVPAWRAMEVANCLPDGGRIMALDLPAPFYLARPWVAEGTVNEPPLVLWLRAGDSATELLARLAACDVRTLVVTPGWGGGSGSLLLLASTPAEARTVLAFARHLELAASVDRVDVYRVRRPDEH